MKVNGVPVRVQLGQLAPMPITTAPKALTDIVGPAQAVFE